MLCFFFTKTYLYWQKRVWISCKSCTCTYITLVLDLVVWIGTMKSCIYLTNSDFSQKIIDIDFQLPGKVHQDVVIYYGDLAVWFLIVYNECWCNINKLWPKLWETCYIYSNYAQHFFSLYLQTAENLPELIERTVFHTFGRLINNTYKRKMRSLVFTLKHRDTIREKVIGGDITVKKLVTLSVDELIDCANENSK